MQHGQQKGKKPQELESYGLITITEIMVGRITQLECCNQWLETAQKGQAKKEEQAGSLHVEKPNMD